MAGFDTDKFYLGKLCKRGHDWNGTGRSLRYKSTTGCILCSKEYCKKYSEHIKLLQKEWYEKNSEKVKLASKEWSKKNPEKEKLRKIKWREKNLERANTRDREWREKNPDKAKLINKINAKKWREKNPEKAKLNVKKWYEKNPERVKLLYENWYKKNKEIVKLNTKKWSEKNPEKVKLNAKKWSEKNPEKVKLSAKKWYEKNPEKVKLNVKKWRRKERDINPKFRLNCNISSGISSSLKGNKNGRHWEDLVGYTLADLKKHLEQQFTKKNGYTWENYGQWHIDHIIPISKFNFSKPEHPDFKRCWALKNLRPLWGPENISKGAKIEKPFQPMLQLEIEVVYA